MAVVVVTVVNRPKNVYTKVETGGTLEWVCRGFGKDVPEAPWSPRGRGVTPLGGSHLGISGYTEGGQEWDVVYRDPGEDPRWREQGTV